MTPAISKMRNTVFAVMLGLGIQGCGCETWGCADGLTVMFDAMPTGPWKVDLFVNGELQTPPADASCDSEPRCKQQIGVRYGNFLPTRNVSVRITTNAGVRETNFSRITYGGKSPRFDCHDCKGQAQVTANIP